MEDIEFHNDMVNRKLTEKFMEVVVEIPWANFEEAAETIIECLDDESVVMTMADLVNRKEFVKRMEREFMTMIEHAAENYLYDMDLEYHTITQREFAKEIKAEHDRIAAEQKAYHEAQMAKAAAEAQAAAEARKKLLEEGKTFHIEKKYAKKAEAILRAAGYWSGE